MGSLSVTDDKKTIAATMVLQSRTWLGLPVRKIPPDLMALQEVIYETKPDIIIETGTFWGGSGLFMAGILESLGKGRIISIDLVAKRNRHPRMVCLGGNSTSTEILERVRSLIKPSDRVMVDLDSAHNLEHVRKELELYGPLVTPGNYLIVEDTNVGDPAEAVSEFLGANPQFIVDKSREKFSTFFPGGWLRRVGSACS